MSTKIVFAGILIGVFQAAFGEIANFQLTYHANASTWKEANTSCQANGGSLVKYDSQTKVDWIESLNSTSSDEYWIGLYDMDPPNGVYTWTDGSPLETTPYNRWGYSEPNHKHDCHCIRVDLGDFKTTYCGKSLTYICEKRIAKQDDGSNHSESTTSASSYTDITHRILQTTTGSDETEQGMFSLTTSPTVKTVQHKSHVTITAEFATNPRTTQGETTRGYNITPPSGHDITRRVQPTDSLPNKINTTDMCRCQCRVPIINEEAFMNEILKTIDIGKENTSSWKRKYMSVTDERPSAQGIGFCGVISLAVLFGVILLLDIATLFPGFFG